jgi:hypothetical protein
MASGITAVVLAACAVAVAGLPAKRAGAQTVVATKTFANDQYHYAVAMPAACRHEEGPGTVDAVCSADLNPERGAPLISDGALVMEVGAEVVAGDAEKTAPELAQAYDETAFREELPEAVCGESDKARVKIANVTRSIEDGRVNYAANLTCAAVRFLQIGERRASVRYIIGPDARYRLVARAPTDGFAKQQQAIEAFFESFRVLPAGK